jgi:predicted aldo/keto reductase-like oxidoreductase
MGNGETGLGQSSRGISGWAVAILWLITFVLAYFWMGRFVGESVEGIDSRLIPKWPVAVCIASALLSLVVTWVWALRRVPQAADGAAPSGVGRRRFLAGAATTLGGLVGGAVATFARPLGWITVTNPAIGQPQVPTSDPNPKDEWKGSRIRALRRLGRTEARVSDIVLGSGRIKGEKGEAIAREAIARGVNYFDTSPDYSEEGSELALGRAMKGHRDRMFVATKFCTPQGHLRQGTPVSEYISAVEASLRRLQTDRVDLVHVHACDSVERLMDPNCHEAFDRLKEQGKVRFLGVSTHTPDLEAVADAAIDSGRFDVLMLAYHYGAWPRLGEIVKRAHEQDVGIVAMKTLKGAKHRGLMEMRPEADSYTQAAFKWVLANPHVSCLVISFFEPQHVDEYLYASGKKLTEADLALLEKYDRLIAGTHCLPHCGACLGSCPEQLPIHDVLRHRMYFEDYGWEQEAMRLYARLERQADVCIGCAAPCTGACPHGIPIQERTIDTHRLLTLA